MMRCAAILCVLLVSVVCGGLVFSAFAQQGTPSLASQGGTIPLTSSGAAEGSNVLKGSAGNLKSLTITTGATAGFLMIFNATSAPADGAVTPAYCSQMPANTTAAYEWAIPVPFATGITVVFSTTGCFTKTVSATAAFFGQVS